MKTIAPWQYLAWAVALASGCFIGWKSTSRAEPGGASGAEPMRQTARPGIPERGGRTSRETALKMKTVRSADTQEERIRASISLAMSLPASEFAAWAQGDRFDFRAGPELSIFRMILFERWIVEDPEGLVAFSVNNNHGQAYRGVAQLLKDDPKRVIGYFREHPNDAFELGKLAEIAKNDPALALSRLAEMSERGLASGDAEKSAELFRAMAAKSPEMLEAAMDGLSPALRKHAEIALVGERLGKSFAEEVRALWDRPDGWEIFNDVMRRQGNLAKNLAGELANMPAAWRNSLADFPYYAVRDGSAAGWLDTDLAAAGFNAEQIKSIRRHALQEMANSDPAGAISRLGAMELTEDERSRILTSAFSRYMNQPERAEQLIAMLSSDEDRAQARKQIELAAIAHGQDGAKAPSDWLRALDGSTGGSNFSWHLARDTGRWDAGQIAEFNRGFEAMSAEGKSKVAAQLASRAEDPGGNDSIIGGAVKYLVENPPEAEDARRSRNDPATAASAFAVRLASNDLSSASSWIDSLPRGEAKTWARRNVARDIRQYDPAAVREWIRTLPKEEGEDLDKYLAEEK